MWTRRKIFLFALSVVTLSVSVLYLSLPLFCTGLIFLIYLLVVPRPKRVSLKMKRRHGRKICFIGDRTGTTMEITKSNEGTEFFEIWDRIPGRMGVKEGKNGGIYSIRGNDTRKLEYFLSTPYRGDFILGSPVVMGIDPMGLQRDVGEISGELTTTISVLPYVKDVSNLEARQVVPKVYPGTFLVKQVGNSTQFWSIRDYVKGDAYKTINWKASARKRKLLVNVNEKESTCDVIIILDGRIVNAVGTIRDNPFEYAMRGGAGIASFLLMRGNDVGLVIYSSKIGIILPKGGQSQMDTINTYLTKVLPSGNLPMKFAMDVAKNYIPPKSTIIVFSTLMYDPTIVVTVRDLVSKGNRVIVVVLSSCEFETSMFHIKPNKSRLIDLEYKIIREKIRAMGAKVISWSLNESIDVVIDRVNLQ